MNKRKKKKRKTTLVPTSGNKPCMSSLYDISVCPAPGKKEIIVAHNEVLEKLLPSKQCMKNQDIVVKKREKTNANILVQKHPKHIEIHKQANLVKLSPNLFKPTITPPATGLLPPTPGPGDDDFHPSINTPWKSPVLKHPVKVDIHH